MSRPSPTNLSFALFTCLVVTLAACAPAATGPRVWIDVPTTGARIDPGQELRIRSHAYAPGGVAEVLLSVNGEPYSREPVAAVGEAFSHAAQTWTADQPGEYSLRVVAYDVAGAASAPAVVWVTVGSPLAPALLAPSTPSQPIVTEGPTAAPATPTSTPSPPVTAKLWVDQAELTAGECTTLHWDTAFATQVFLGTTAVDAMGAMQICPQDSTAYRLRASGPSGEIERTVGLAVTAPQDTEGPSLSGLSNSPASIWDGSGCGATTATVTVTATDASGVAKVELHYRVVKGSEQGEWRVRSMSPAGGNTYSATLGPAELGASLALYGGGTVEYRVRASDSQGNSAQSGKSTFSAQVCFG
ncbi:MAG: Ig-like domain-containing protein [Anaerolineales bacterium]|nr:Ig-like domain-containing protein [Anaerolineales bacterium]